jgi:hypothetical protein
MSTRMTGTVARGRRAAQTPIGRLRGRTTATLHLSAHRARPHQEQLREGRRLQPGELMAKLFAEHHAPAHLHPRTVERVAAPG